jgi:hypothetical protein
MKVKKQRKSTIRLRYEITGTSKDSTQSQRKPVKNVQTPVMKDKDEASSDNE